MVNYNHRNGRETRDQPYLSVERKRMTGCKCYNAYCKSVQGICKIAFMICAFLVFVIIGASPYFEPIFVLDYQTWPFHLVMLFDIVSWISVIIAFAFFTSGYHLNQPHIAWPKRELIFNCIVLAMVFLAMMLELTNIWRWDPSNIRDGIGDASRYIRIRYGNTYGGLGGYGMGGPVYGTGGRNSYYCGIVDSRFCDSYLLLLQNYNPYLANHIIAGVLLVVLFVIQIIAFSYSYRTYRRFKRDMSRGGAEPEPKLKLWTRLRFHLWNLKTNSSNAIRNGSSSIREKIEDLKSGNTRSDVDGSCTVDLDDVTPNFHPSNTTSQTTIAASVSLNHYETSSNLKMREDDPRPSSGGRRSSSGTRYSDKRSSSRNRSSSGNRSSDKRSSSGNRSSDKRSSSGNRSSDKRSSSRNRSSDKRSTSSRIEEVSSRSRFQESSTFRSNDDEAKSSPMASFVV